MAFPSADAALEAAKSLAVTVFIQAASAEAACQRRDGCDPPTVRVVGVEPRKPPSSPLPQTGDYVPSHGT